MIASISSGSVPSTAIWMPLHEQLVLDLRWTECLEGEDAVAAGDLGQFHQLLDQGHRVGGLGEDRLHADLRQGQEAAERIRRERGTGGAADDDQHRRRIDVGARAPAQEDRHGHHDGGQRDAGNSGDVHGSILWPTPRGETATRRRVR